MLDLEGETAAEVVRAIRNHAVYNRGYRQNGTIAAVLERVAAELEHQISAPEPARKPAAREDAAEPRGNKRRRA